LLKLIEDDAASCALRKGLGQGQHVFFRDVEFPEVLEPIS